MGYCIAITLASFKTPYTAVWCVISIHAVEFCTNSATWKTQTQYFPCYGEMLAFSVHAPYSTHHTGTEMLSFRPYAIEYTPHRDRNTDSLRPYALQYTPYRDRNADSLRPYAIQYTPYRDRNADSLWPYAIQYTPYRDRNAESTAIRHKVHTIQGQKC